MPSDSIHVFTNGKISFFFLRQSSIQLYILSTFSLSAYPMLVSFTLNTKISFYCNFFWLWACRWEMFMILFLWHTIIGQILSFLCLSFSSAHNWNTKIMIKVAMTTMLTISQKLVKSNMFMYSHLIIWLVYMKYYMECNLGILFLIIINRDLMRSILFLSGSLPTLGPYLWAVFIKI